MVHQVRAICRISNPLLRNLRITDCYHELSSRFSSRLGFTGANWCTFATWASRQAGCTIRGEDILERLNPRTPRLWRAILRVGVLDPRTAAGWIVQHAHTPFDAVEHASQAVATGNLKVFEEIGEEFARSLEDSGYLPSQPLLRSAFIRYTQAPRASSDNERACLILLANVECGFHEQTRLQTEIASAMTAPLATMRDLVQRYAPVFSEPADRLAALLKDLTCEIVSQGFMTLKLPNGDRLRLGRDLDAAIPDCFSGLESDPLLAQFESAGHEGSGAENWADLQQRMRYISRLFRCLHADATLFNAPFSDRQRESMKQGRLPRGRL